MEQSQHLLGRQVTEITRTANSKVNFSVLQWNVLAKCYASTETFPTVEPEYLDWDYRKNLIAQEIKNYNADVICLEEVDVRDLEFFKSLYPEDQYSFSYIKKPHSKDGICVMLRKEKFQVIDTDLITHLKEDGVQKENLVSQVVLAKYDNGGIDAYLILAACHLKADSPSADFTGTRLRQVRQIMDAVEKKRNHCLKELGANENNSITLVCGDFNEGPKEPAAQEFLKYKEIGLKSAFEDEPYTLFQTYGSSNYLIKSTVDHILYSKNLQLTKKIGAPAEGVVGENGLISKNFPSDHLSLFAEFSLVENQETPELSSEQTL